MSGLVPLADAVAMEYIWQLGSLRCGSRWQVHLPGREDINAKAGPVHHIDAPTRLPERRSKKPFEDIAVELKG